MPDHACGIDPARRRFLGAAAVGGGLLVTACGQAASQENKPAAEPGNSGQPAKPAREALSLGALLCGGNKIPPGSTDPVFVFTQTNIDGVVRDRGVSAENTRLITDIGFLAHGVIKHPSLSHRVAVFEKKGPGGCEIDLKENKLIRRIQPSKGCEFYGHGAYSADAKILYATEFDKQSYEGRMVLRDASDMKVIGEFPTHGDWPHDCQFIEDGKVVAVTNGGGHLEGGSLPNVAYISVPDGRLIERVTFDNELINSGHLLVSSRGDLAVAHAMREGYHGEEALGALSLRPKSGVLKTMVTPAGVTGAMKGETLSIVLHEESSVVAATNPYGEGGGLITFWNMSRQEYVGHERIEQPRGVALTLDQRYWVFTFGKAMPGVILFDRETRKKSEPPIAFECATQGSHAYIHDYWA
jgi:hypothetical protein